MKILYFLSFLKEVHGGEKCFPPGQFANHSDTTCPLVCTAGFLNITVATAEETLMINRTLP